MTTLILVALTASKKPDGRSSAVKALKKVAKTYEFAAFREYELDEVIKRQAVKRNINLSRAAIAYLIEAVGTDLASLVDAVERIDLYLGDDRPNVVEPEQVSNIVASTRVHSVFTLTEALGKRNFERALVVLSSMLHAGDSAIGIVAMIARHFRIIAKLHDPSLKRLSKQETARTVGVVPFFLDDYKRDANMFSVSDVIEVRRMLLGADTSLKSSRLRNHAVVERLVFDICLRKAA